MATRIILIRHGQTSFNLKKIYCSFTDVSLNKLGIKEAEKLSARLTKENIHHVYSSDLKRAFQFAKIAFKGFVIKKSPELREMDFGIFEGLTHSQILKKYPKLYRAWLSDPLNTVIPNGDRFCDFKDRIKMFVKKIITANKNRTVAFVTHAGPIRIIISDILKSKDIWSINVELASINIIEYKNNKAKIHLLNDMKHLIPPSAGCR